MDRKVSLAVLVNESKAKKREQEKREMHFYGSLLIPTFRLMRDDECTCPSRRPYITIAVVEGRFTGIIY